MKMLATHSTSQRVHMQTVYLALKALSPSPTKSTSQRSLAHLSKLNHHEACVTGIYPERHTNVNYLDLSPA